MALETPGLEIGAKLPTTEELLDSSQLNLNSAFNIFSDNIFQFWHDADPDTKEQLVQASGTVQRHFEICVGFINELPAEERRASLINLLAGAEQRYAESLGENAYGIQCECDSTEELTNWFADVSDANLPELVAETHRLNLIDAMQRMADARFRGYDFDPTIELAAVTLPDFSKLLPQEPGNKPHERKLPTPSNEMLATGAFTILALSALAGLIRKHS
jgi:hypothetical protein